MANTPKNMNLVKQIFLLHNSGLAKKEIARQVGVSKNTVKSYLSKAAASGESMSALVQLETPVLMSKLLEVSGGNRERYNEFLTHAERLLAELKAHKHLTKYQLWKEEFEAGRIHYKYTQFCEHMGAFERHRSSSSVIRHSPGEKMYMDFAGDKLHLTDCHSGKLTPCEILVVTLGYSNFTWVVALPSQRLGDVIEGTVAAIHAIGGAAKALVPDNFKSAITKADRYEPMVNVRFLDMANYYGITVLPARPGKPKDKAKVEGAVNHVYHRIYSRLRNQIFSDINELNAALSRLCVEFNDAVMKSYGKSRRERLEQEERAHLLELPAERYRPVEEYKLKVQTNNHVYIGKRSQYYSVPHHLIGQQVSVLISGRLLKVYHQGQCVATHVLGHGLYHSQDDHMGSAHKAYLASINPDLLKSRALEIDPAVHAVICRIIDRSRHPEQNYKSCQGILALHKKFGSAKLIEGCSIALQADVISLRYIRNICENPYSGTMSLHTQGALPLHENIRGNYH